VFAITCKDLAWAVIDSGVDARHQAFQSKARSGKGKESRVRKSYDFTRLRPLLSLDSHPSTGPSRPLSPEIDLEDADRRFKQMRQRLRSGQALDWAQLEPLIDISLDTKAYTAPEHDHGTHVAGIIGACDEAEQYFGVCQDISLYDLRVLDDKGRGEEFAIIAALQFIRFLNARSDQLIIHGVNLSLSLLHDVENFACGRTPICDECDRLVASGVVVVAAAGNRGYERVLTAAGELEAYRAISITDPGNADSVLTVGATHRYEPHTYGVSYFSSRGPTGDGRVKPDLLGPGERVYSTLPGNQYGAKDGTSMAAPHVSGVAALLMARHAEFIGQPARVKQILMKTATDLGRQRYFQGAGMIDALRALQSV
jgi:serine protease AprX